VSDLAWPDAEIRDALEQGDEAALFDASERMYRADLTAARRVWPSMLEDSRPHVRRVPAFFLSWRFAPADVRRVTRADHDLLMRALRLAGEVADVAMTVSSLNALSGFLARVRPPQPELALAGKALVSMGDAATRYGPGWDMVRDDLDGVLHQLANLALLDQALTPEDLRRLSARDVRAAGGYARLK